MESQEFRRSLRDLLDASLEELTAMEMRATLPSSLEAYRKVLLAFLSGDAVELSRLENEILERAGDWQAEAPFLPIFTRTRIELLTYSFGPETLSQLEQATGDPLWAGEALMLMATVKQESNQVAEAIADFKKAAKAFLQLGAKGKSLRARFNALTLTGHLDPRKKLVQEYYFLYREARRFRQPSVALSALINISREYQKIGALKMALKFVNRAIARGSAEAQGYLYFLSIAHRAHVLFELGRITEAQIDLEEANTASFPAVKEACAALSAMMNGGDLSSEPTKLRTWQERAADWRAGMVKAKLSPNEEKFIQFISLQPRTKYEAMSHLFGEKIDIFAAENRLKNIIFRIRKKAPGLLVYENDHYFLSDRDLQPKRQSG